MVKDIPERFGLPFRPFLYTLDQLADLLNIQLKDLKSTYLFFLTRSPGVPRNSELKAVNIAADGEKPEWRVAEKELVRWLRYKGFHVYDRTSMR